MAKSERLKGIKLNQSINQALDGDVPTPMIFRPQDINGKNVREVAIVRKQKMPTIEEHIVRIHNEADPIGFLIAAQQGYFFEQYVIDKNGNIETVYVQASLEQRLIIAKYLTDRLIPKIGILKHIPPGGPGDGGGGSNNDRMSFAQVVEIAASREPDEE